MRYINYPYYDSGMKMCYGKAQVGIIHSLGTYLTDLITQYSPDKINELKPINSYFQLLVKLHGLL